MLKEHLKLRDLEKNLGEIWNELNQKEDVSKNLSDEGRIFLNKENSSVIGLGLILTNSEIKDITKVISSLENRGILLKGTIEKIVNEKEGFLVYYK